MPATIGYGVMGDTFCVGLLSCFSRNAISTALVGSLTLTNLKIPPGVLKRKLKFPYPAGTGWLRPERIRAKLTFIGVVEETSTELSYRFTVEKSCRKSTSYHEESATGVAKRRGIDTQRVMIHSIVFLCKIFMTKKYYMPSQFIGQHGL